ncbi:MAG TPA: T9SS type A sorting domain-containing protein, partial [Puia sp.]|nr:T9SS type A sorting domain-containing protein [Puia sp.]
TAGGLVNGDVVTVSLTSNAVCASPDTVTSLPSIVAVLPRPGVTISGDTVGDPAATDHLVSIVVNGGVNPVYLWQDSTSAHSWQTIGGAAGGTVNYSPMVGGDYVRCIVTGSDGCTAASNTLSLTVITIPNTVRYYPNPAGPTLYVENMDPMDPIETITVFTAAGNRVISLGNLTSQVKIAIDVASLNPGIYYVSLTRQSGKTDRFQFMKR